MVSKLAHDGRQLDRDVVDIRPTYDGQHAGQAIVGLTLAEHRFAEDVDIEAQSSLA